MLTEGRANLTLGNKVIAWANGFIHGEELPSLSDV